LNDTSILLQKLLVAASLNNMREDYINNGVCMRRVQILVVGSDSDHCTELANKLAYEVGEEVALKGAVLVTGGLGGVMEAASKGAKARGGLVVGIIPQNEKRYANAYCDVVISTGLGYSRNFVTAYSGDAVIVVGGGAGTAIEARVAYLKGKPIIAIKGNGGTADKIGGHYLDDRREVKVMAEEGPKIAVEKIFKALADISMNEGKKH
jgi:uncharacterized protein (TIGR00725 family)